MSKNPEGWRPLAYDVILIERRDAILDGAIVRKGLESVNAAMSVNESICRRCRPRMVWGTGLFGRTRPPLAPGEPAAERDSFGEVVLAGRLREAIRRLNVSIPAEAQEEALRKVLRVGTPSLTQTNRAFHRMLRDGVPVEYPRPDGSIAGDHVTAAGFRGRTGERLAGGEPVHGDRGAA